MNWRNLVDLVNLFCAGLLAGAEVAIHLGLPVHIAGLDDPSQIRFRQALTRRLRVLMPTLFAPTALSAIAVTALEGNSPGLWLRCLGVCAVLIWILTRVVATVPVNSATLTWQPTAPPEDWKQRVKQAERFHVAGTCAAVVIFASFLTAAMPRLAKQPSEPSRHIGELENRVNVASRTGLGGRDLQLGTAHFLTVTDIDLAFSELDFLVSPASDSLQGIARR